MGNVYKHTWMEIAQLNCVRYLKQYSVEDISGARITNAPENEIWDIIVPTSFTA